MAAWALASEKEEANMTLATVTAKDRSGLDQPQVDPMERMVEYANALEAENSRLRRELAEARGDLADADVGDAAAAIAEWVRSEFPDDGDRNAYVRSYLMDPAYLDESRKSDGPGHARARLLAARMVLGPTELLP